MAVYVFHGDDQDASLQAYQVKRAHYPSDCQFVNIDAKTASLAELTDALAQDSFFGDQRVVVIQNLFARPKSKIRDAWCQQIADANIDILIWEGKKLTPTALKSLGKPTIYVSPPAKSMWALVAMLAPDNNNQRFIKTYEKAVQENSANGDPGILLTATFLWRVQQLIDIKLGHANSKTFNWEAVQNQAEKFSLEQLVNLHHRLIWLDFQAKTGQLTLPVSQELLLILTALI